MSFTTLTLPHLPTDLQLHIALFTSVRNAPFLRTQLLEGNKDFEYALIDASTILFPPHLYAAVFRACNDYTNNRMKSRNVHSEIVFCLGFNNNIGQTLNTFGISEQTSELLVLKIVCPSLGLSPALKGEDVWSHLKGSVEGEALEYGEVGVGRCCDVEKVRRVYKLGGGREQSAKGRRRRKDGGREGARQGERDVKGAETPVVSLEGLPNGENTEVAQRKELEMQILGLMALRGAV